MKLKKFPKSYEFEDSHFFVKFVKKAGKKIKIIYLTKGNIGSGREKMNKKQSSF